jgi:hypothetical protein
MQPVTVVAAITIILMAVRCRQLDAADPDQEGRVLTK